MITPRSAPALRAYRPARTALTLLAAFIAGSTLAACDTTKTLTPDERAAVSPPQHEKIARLGYRIEWRGFPALAPGGVIQRMEILGDAVATLDSAAELSILETRSGERRWSDAVANPLTKFVGLNRDGKRIIVSSESQAYFYDVDTGSLLAKQNFAENVNTRPVQIAEILVYGATNGRVLGHLMLNGFQQWGAITGGTIETDPVLIGSGGTVGVVSDGGDIAFYDALSGSLRGWNHTYGGTSVPVAASDTAMFVASRDHSLYAFSIEQARLLSRVRTEAPLSWAPVFHDGRVYCDMGETGLTAYDAKSGKELWNNKFVRGSVLAVHSGHLIVWDGHVANVVDPARGGSIDSIDFKDIAIVKADQFVDGHLYIVSDAGVVAKLTSK